MAAINLRESVLNYVQNADSRFLKLVKALADSYDEEDEIVAYTVEGKPLTRTAYHKELIASENEIDKGKFTTQEDLEKESENW